MLNKPCLRCNPKQRQPSHPNYDPVYEGFYIHGICGTCGAAEGKRVVKRYKHSPIGGKRGRNSGKTKQSKKSR